MIDGRLKKETELVVPARSCSCSYTSPLKANRYQFPFTVHQQILAGATIHTAFGKCEFIIEIFSYKRYEVENLNAFGEWKFFFANMKEQDYGEVE